jgi:hypothetical protein
VVEVALQSAPRLVGGGDDAGVVVRIGLVEVLYRSVGLRWSAPRHFAR